MLQAQGTHLQSRIHPPARARGQVHIGKGLRCCTAVSAGTSSRQPAVGRKLERQEVRQRLRKVVDLIRIADDFAPFDRPSYNIALEIW